MGETFQYTAVADGHVALGKRVAANVTASVLALVTIVLLGKPAWVARMTPGLASVRQAMESLTIESMRFSAELITGSEVHVNAHGVMITENLEIVRESLLETVDTALVLTLAAVLLTIAAWKTWGLRPATGLALVCLNLLLPGALLLVLSGALQGLLAADAVPRSMLGPLWRIAKGIADAVAFAAVGGTWWLGRWATASDDTAQSAGQNRVRPTSLWAANAASLLVLMYWTSATIAVLLHVGPDAMIDPRGDPLRIARYMMGEICLLAASAMLLLSLVKRSSAARRAWIPLLCMAAIGSEAGGGLALLLACLVSGDRRLAEWTANPT